MSLLEVVQKLLEMFKGHTNLIIGFNTFLPSDCKIEVLFICFCLTKLDFLQLLTSKNLLS